MKSSKNKSLSLTALAAASTAVDGACYDSSCADEVLEQLASEEDLISSSPSRAPTIRPIGGISGGGIVTQPRDDGTTIEPLLPLPSLIDVEVVSDSADREIISNLAREELEEETGKELFKEEIINPSISQERADLNFFGRKTTYLFGDNSLGLNYEDYLDSKPIIENRIYVQDPVRGRTGGYLSTKQDRLTLLNKHKELQNFSPLKYDFREYFLFTNNYSSIKLSKQRNRIIEGNILERVSIFKNKNYFSNDNEGNKLFLSYNYGQQFTGELKNYGRVQNYQFESTVKLDRAFIDAGTIFDSPYSEDEKKSIKFPMNSLVYDIKTDYNFYIRQYEELFDSQIEESQLPNMYSMLYYENLENPPEELARIYTLNGNIKSSEIKGNNFKGQYFDKFSRIYLKKPNDIISTKNIYIAPGELSKINEFNSKKVMFPMFADLKFSVSKTRRISNILDETNFLNKFCFKIAEKDVEGQFLNTNFFSETILDAAGQLTRDQNRIEQSNGQIKYIDFEDLFQEIVDEEADIIENPEILIIDDKKERITIKDSFLRTIYSLILKSKMFSLVKEKNRNYRDIVENRKNCYSETLMYKISKFKGNQISDQPIQNIYLINEPFLDVINYVDTQLKYEQEYFYVIYAYEVIIGNEYRYLSQQVQSNKIRVSSLTKPKIIIAEIPFLNKFVRVYDSSPPPPEVNIEYYKGKDNKLLLMFNSSINTYKSEPVIVDGNDEEIFSRISEQQNVLLGEPLEFSSDDKIDSYQVFRTTKKPTNYQQFSGNFLTQIFTGKASSASFVDTISPNIKYYYMFRAIDVHGKPSNPTEVYEVEMINENGTIFALKKSFIPVEEIRKEQSKPFKRFIKIQPSVQQTLMDEEYNKYKNSKNINEAIKNTNLGLTKPSVWGKKFKVRLVSKQSKKVIDFNIKFDIKKDYLNNTGK